MIVAGAKVAADTVEIVDTPRVSCAVDIRVFNALIADLGNAQPGLREELLEGYLLQSGPQVTELVAAAGSSDVRTVGRIAHLMRSSSALLGAMQLAHLLELAEANARLGTGDDLGSIVDRIRMEYGRVEAHMMALRS